jgi:hypothetical protein
MIPELYTACNFQIQAGIAYMLHQQQYCTASFLQKMRHIQTTPHWLGLLISCGTNDRSALRSGCISSICNVASTIWVSQQVMPRPNLCSTRLRTLRLNILWTRVAVMPMQAGSVLRQASQLSRESMLCMSRLSCPRTSESRVCAAQWLRPQGSVLHQAHGQALDDKPSCPAQALGHDSCTCCC